MRVPMLDLSEQYRSLADPIRAEIEDVLASQRFILGPRLDAFEKKIAAYLNVPHAIGVSSGTDALLAALMALGTGPGDALLTTDFSFFATAGCIARLGATPVFVDIDPTTYNISIAALKKFFESECQNGGKRSAFPTIKSASGQRLRLRGIMPIHLFGLCCEIDQIKSLAEQFNIPVIEDAAQAIGAEFPGLGKGGTIGDLGCFSFYPSKNLGAAGDAGLVVCRNEDLAKTLRICRQHGMEPRYEHHFIGGNFRLDELQAAILNVKLPHLDTWSAARRAAADVYRGEFEKAGLTTMIGLPAEPYRDRGVTNHHIYHQYVIRTPRRDELRAYLAKQEIETAIYYPLALHEQKCFQYLGYKPGDFPESERAARETLALPIYPEIAREAQRFVVNAIVEFFK
jgi:dTDP-4-amino-4,6-dideoxygalactose transaminase